jgi:transcriptional regulator with XRE-family HTH domain
VDDIGVGRVVRAIRIRAGWRQQDLAAAAGVSQAVVSRVERGRLERVSLPALRRICDALDVRLDMTPRWRGGELDRLLGGRHSAMHEAMARRFASLAGWEAIPEVTFSVWGERGSIDVLGWHAATRTLLVTELKTEIVDVQELLGTLDRKCRLARAIAAERGWAADLVAAWLVVAESPTNRRRVAQHRDVLRAVLPAGGREMDRWLQAPAGRIAALTFLSSSRQTNGDPGFAPVRRVRRREPGRRRAA